jgi:hypothetical protein
MKRLSADLMMTMSAASERSSSSPFRDVALGQNQTQTTPQNKKTFAATILFVTSQRNNLFRPIHNAHTNTHREMEGTNSNAGERPWQLDMRITPSLSRFFTLSLSRMRMIRDDDDDDYIHNQNNSRREFSVGGGMVQRFCVRLSYEQPERHTTQHQLTSTNRQRLCAQPVRANLWLV